MEQVTTPPDTRADARAAVRAQRPGDSTSSEQTAVALLAIENADKRSGISFELLDPVAQPGFRLPVLFVSGGSESP